MSRRLVVAAVVVPTTLAGLSSYTVSAALAHIGGAVGAGPAEMTWALTAHIVAYSIALPLAPWLADHLGEKRTFLASIATLVAGSLLAGTAGSLEMLIAARLIQGLAGGAMVPVAQTILMRVCSRSRALALWSLAVAAGSIAGPTVGGAITEWWGWPWIFFVNVPIGLASLALARAVLDDRPRAPRPLDLVAVGLLALGVGALQVVLETGQRLEWFDSPFIVAWSTAAALALSAFVWRERRAARPFMDLGVFRNGTFTLGCLLMAAVGCCQSAAVTVSSLHAERLLGLGPLMAGAVMAPAGVATALAILGAGLVPVGPRPQIVAGAALAALGMFQGAGLPIDATVSDLLWPRLEVGLGLGLLLVSLARVTLGALGEEEARRASGVFNLVRNVGASAGIAGLRSLLDRGSQAHQMGLVNDLHAPVAMERAQALASALRARGSTSAEAQAWGTIYGCVRRQALHLAFLDGYRALALVLAAVIPLVLLMRQRRIEVA